MDDALDPQMEQAARDRLTREHERVERLIADGREAGLDREDAAAHSGDLAHVGQHPADRGTETSEREKDLAILESLEAELAEIEAALQRLDDGTYGIDERTGDLIHPERAVAQP
ncbi:MAG: hypothetical protein ACKOOG_00280, partial [Actinomycetota bacterium]